MVNWKEIHPDFTLELQKEWGDRGFDSGEVKEWIELDFKPNELYKVEEWKNFNFSANETKVWLELGLDKDDREFASWLRTNNYTPELVKDNLEQLRNDYEEFRINNSQAWLEQVYPNHNTKELNISEKKLKGELNFSQYQQLERLNCWINNLTNIILPTNPTSLKVLGLSWNNFNQDLSFLVPYTNLEKLYLWNNKFTGSLDYLSSMEQLKDLDIRNTDINEVNIDKIPRSLERIWCDCKLTAIAPLLEKVRYGWCKKCKEPRTSYQWCQPCVEQEWEQLTGQELINKFIERQKERSEGSEYNQLQWIPYEKFTDIKYLAEGGFSKIYKAKWEREKKSWESDYVVLKVLNNSQNITVEFLTEIANTKIVDNAGGEIVRCYGISQNLTTKDYLMVMEYMEEGDLRQYLQNKGNKLSLEDKLNKLGNIATGLRSVQNQNLVHQDFHSGNILNSGWRSSTTDLGLCRPVNHQKQTGQIFGVLPYVAPEVLQGKPYTKASDIYSFGIVAYELLGQTYPYPKMGDMNLTLQVCQGLRPDIDKVPIPQEMKDLIKKCWDSNPDKRPKTEELYKIIISNWTREIKDQKNTPFYQQFKEIEEEYNTFSQNTPYQIHSNATLTSKMIDTKKITQQLEKLRTMECSKSLQMDFLNLNLEENNSDWTNIHSSFTPELIKKWQSLGFIYQQTQDWINIGLQPTDHNFCAWLRDNKHFTPEQVLNHHNREQLNQEFFTYWQEQQQANIEIPPK